MSFKRNSDSCLMFTPIHYLSSSSEFIISNLPDNMEKSNRRTLLDAVACYSESDEDDYDKMESNRIDEYGDTNSTEIIAPSRKVQSFSLRVRPSSTSPSVKRSTSKSWNQTKAMISLKNLKEFLPFGGLSRFGSKNNMASHSLRAAQRLLKTSSNSDTSLSASNTIINTALTCNNN